MACVSRKVPSGTTILRRVLRASQGILEGNAWKVAGKTEWGIQERGGARSEGDEVVEEVDGGAARAGRVENESIHFLVEELTIEELSDTEELAC